ncbi:MAG TPA: DUF1223 domain-containing protein [Chthoniobacterales bacterium]|nr:DUF1223 domain-containing protein [Chthoniobacterales bacterium]
MPFKIPAPIIRASISLKLSQLHKEKLIGTRWLIFISLIAGTLSARAGDRGFESGPQRTHLIELFTSQGCSSCPPAEAWLSKLKNEPGLWKDFVPLAFHVDYWDRLGWRDPFASKEWTARQYQYSANWKSESIYTPGFVLDGREWLQRNLPVSSSETPGALRLSVTKGKIVGEFIPAGGAPNNLDLYVALLTFEQTTNVTAGENNGRKLSQDFVVMSLIREKMPAGKVEAPVTIYPEPPAPNPIGAIAAWVTAPNQIEPIQAVGGWLR